MNYSPIAPLVTHETLFKSPNGNNSAEFVQHHMVKTVLNTG